MLHKTFTLLTIDLSMFGDAGAPGAAGTAAPAGGDGNAPAAEAPAAAPEVRYGKQPEQTVAPQQETPTQTQNPETPDKGKQFKELIKGEFKDQYTEETQKMLNRRFRDTDAKINAMQPVMDLLASRYGIEDGDPSKIMNAVKSDTAFWQEAADAAGLSVEQYRSMRELEARNRQLLAAQQNQQAQFLAQRRYQQWQAEAEIMKQKYPNFSLDEMQGNDLFMLMLKNNYPMEQAYKACNPDQLAAQAAANAEKAVTANIQARGSRPAEAGANATPAFTVKDDVSKLTDKDVLNILSQISNGGRVSFS